MSQIAATDHAIEHAALAHENVHLPAPAASRWSNVLIFVGVVGLLLTVGRALALDQRAEALAAFLIGTIVAIGLSLGSLFFVMVFGLTNAGWSATPRRQFENVASMLPVAVGLFGIFIVIELLGGGILSSWLREPGHLSGGKAGWFSIPFVLARTVVYVAVWMHLLHRIVRPSYAQDRTGDPLITARTRFHSSYGMLLFAFSTTFFAFDWLMALADYRFFSTMWGVYFFAGNILAALALTTFILARLRLAGKIEGAITEEHFHDLGKLIFGFTVFWAYIAFGQYFLIWYGNIPEETSFFIYRKDHWPVLTVCLPVLHFIAPWYVMLWRRCRRDARILVFVTSYMLAMHVLDIFWIVRPVVDQAHPEIPHATATGSVLDVVGIVGVLAVFGGLLVRRVAASPLIPLKDPRLSEALNHKNYV